LWWGWLWLETGRVRCLNGREEEEGEVRRVLLLGGCQLCLGDREWDWSLRNAASLVKTVLNSAIVFI
jgi:hypothetical protein